MATVSAKVYEHHKKKDGTYNVKIIVYHQQDRKHIDTIHFVSKRQLTAEFEIRDKFVNKIIDETLDDYRSTISNMGAKLDFFTCEQLRDYLRDKDKEVDLIEFCTEYIQQERNDKRDGSANNHRRVKNSLIDYFKKDSVSINEITTHMLVSWERYLKSERTLVRVGKHGAEVISVVKGMKKGGVYTIMRDLRTLFNAAVEKYNDDDRGIVKIKHYPFKKYKLGSAPKTRKRNITLEQVKLICDCETELDSWAELARDLFMLSFYMCGMNAVDMYQLDSLNPNQVRLEYNRSKTRDIREDNAFISVLIVDEARPLLEKYAGTLQKRFKTHNGLNTALSIGMKDLCKIVGLIGITFYWARHTFANVARNKGGMHTDDIGLALNHVDDEHSVTDIYIDKDWSLVDMVQNCVIELLRQLNSPQEFIAEQALLPRRGLYVVNT